MELPKFEPNLDEHVDTHIEETPGDARSITYALYYVLIAYENHYNIIQMRYKQVAISWALATFIGIGYLLSGVEVTLPIDIKLAIMFLCLFAAEGIFLLWFLDINVYYKLIESIFSETIKFETKHDFIVKTHYNMQNLQKIQSEPHKFHGLFYLIFIGFFIFVAAASLIMYLFFIHPIIAICAAGFIFLGLLAFILANKKLVYFFTHLTK